MDVNERLEIYRLHAEFCKALSDANRLLIIAELSRGELSVNELTQRLALQQSNVSKHLAFMRESGLVNARREGSSTRYSLADARIFEAINLLRSAQADVLEKRRKLARSSAGLL
ncbi:MAG: transcriptional regulator, ArsR family [Chloroflexi bacterium]|jgi:ArsR family transcriptional regulator|nr:transcriptional regulator, ArsR family [Chloroflexota bacterium]